MLEMKTNKKRILSKRDEEVSVVDLTTKNKKK